MHRPAQTPPSLPIPPTSIPLWLAGPQGDPGGPPTQPLPPTQSTEVLVSGRHLLFPTSTPRGVSGSPHR